jgi:hypothetical protein
MKILEYLVFGIALGVPSAAIQWYLYKRERRLIKKSPLWSAWSDLQRELASTLHKPHPESQELDRLLEKLETFTAAGVSTISDEDRHKLTLLLIRKKDDHKQPKADRLRAEFLLIAMPRAQQEGRQ